MAVPSYIRYDDRGQPYEVEGYRDQNLDDLYWSNKFAQQEREQELEAYRIKMERDEALGVGKR